MPINLHITYAESIKSCTNTEIAQLVEAHTAGITHFKMLMRRGQTTQEGIDLNLRVTTAESMLEIAKAEAERRGMSYIDPRLN